MHPHPLSLLLPLLLSTPAFALPYNCGGTVSTLNITTSTYDGLIWICSNINPNPPSLYGSTQNHLFSLTQLPTLSSCGTHCAAYLPSGMNAGVYYPNTTCECWGYGDPNTSPSAATPESGSATYLDFYETGASSRPNSAQHWGGFTCPDGGYYNTVFQGGKAYGACWPLSIEPEQGGLGGCGDSTSETPPGGTQWEVWTTESGFQVVKACYAELSAVKAVLNFSSPYTLVDVYDFTSHTSTSTSKKTTSTSSNKKTTSTSSSKKTTSTSTHQTSTSTRKSTSTPKNTSSAKKTTSTATVHSTKKS